MVDMIHRFRHYVDNYISIYLHYGDDVISIEICMGSSCYSRGNRKTLEILEQYINEASLADQVTLKGRLCLEACSCGPHIVVDGERVDLVAPEGVIEVLNKYLTAASC